MGKSRVQALHNFEKKDAILDLTDAENPAEPDWPDADFIVGNPPFLGDKKMRNELGDDYVSKLRNLYSNRIPGQSDLCCYWFEKARSQVAVHGCSSSCFAGVFAREHGHLWTTIGVSDYGPWLISTSRSLIRCSRRGCRRHRRTHFRISRS